MAESEEDEIQSELARGEFDLRPGRGSSREKPLKIYVMIAVVIVVVLGGLITAWSWAISKITEPIAPVETHVKGDETLESRPAVDTGMERRQAEVIKKNEEEKKKAEEEERKKAETPPPNTAPPSAPRSGSNQAKAPEYDPAKDPMVRKLGGGILVQADTKDVSTVPGAADTRQTASDQPRRFPMPPDGDTETSAAPAISGNPNRGNLNDLSGPTFAASRAYLAPNGKYLLRHGTYGRCALYTEIVTEQPGYVDCRLTEPLYSADGSTVIAEAGARIEGVQQVEMKPGQTLVFTNWTDLETTAGVRAHLASYGAGPMGASGTKAWVDNHWRDRFGGAVMLTLFKDGLSALTANRQSSNNSGVTFNNTESSVEGMAEKVLDYSINIPPTGTIPAAQVITIVVARDIDFSSVYINR